MNNRGVAQAWFFFFIFIFIFITCRVNTSHFTLGFKVISPRAKHATPKCSNEQWDDASLLSCSALKGISLWKCSESQRLAKCLTWQCTLDKIFLMKQRHQTQLLPNMEYKHTLTDFTLLKPDVLIWSSFFLSSWEYKVSLCEYDDEFDTR